MLGLEDLLDRRPGAALRRPDAARRDGPRDHPRAGGVPDGRAALEPRREAARRRCAPRCSSCTAGIGTTTVYVTHDQVEAMTLGQRVAVMRDGKIQQVDAPQPALRRPREPVRRRLHRLAGDEPRRRRRSTTTRSRSASSQIPLDRERRPPRHRPTERRSPASARRHSRTPRSRARSCRRSRSTVEVLEELGSDAYVFFERRRRAGRRRGRAVGRRGRRRHAARRARQGALRRARRPAHVAHASATRLRLAVDPSRLYFFSPETGESLLGARRRVATA